MMSAFSQIDFTLYHSQLATALYLAHLSGQYSGLLCQYGAGRGKSRVAAAIAFFFLKTSKLPIYMVYPNLGLLQRDKSKCQGLWRFAEGVDARVKDRLHHVCGIESVPKNKRALVIVDESDSIMLEDPIRFFKQVKNPNVHVICLTATPDDGFTEGAERNIIELMGFRQIKTSRKCGAQVPRITQRARFETANDVINVAEERSSYQGVLIYANEPFHTEL